MSSNITPGPNAPYNNPPIEPEYYQPSRFYISAISYGRTTLVTTATDQNYQVGQKVRFIIPSYWNPRNLNGREGYVTVITEDNQVIVNINTIGYTPFGLMGPPSPNKNNFPQIIALGDINSGFINAAGRVLNGTYIPGAFIDVS